MRVKAKEEEPIKTLPLSEVKEGTVIRINGSLSLFLVTNGIVEYRDWDGKWGKRS